MKPLEVKDAVMKPHHDKPSHEGEANNVSFLGRLVEGPEVFPLSGLQKFQVPKKPGTEPYQEAILGVGKLPSISRIHT